MKLTTLLLIVGSFQVSASIYSQDTKINLSIHNGTIQDLFSAIEKQSDFNVFFKTEEINIKTPVNIIASDITIREALSQVLASSKLEYKVLDKIIVVTSTSQQQKITGTVTDATTGLSIPGVSIQVEGTSKGTISDSEGKFSIELSNENATLIFSFIGYLAEKVQVTGQSIIDVKLVPEVKALEDVVVVGYGTQKKVTLTGAVSSIGGDELITTKSESVPNMMMGKLPGLRIVQKDAEPGNYNNQIDIRGLGGPLIIIDGVPRSNFERLEPNDIESISVLKDASAAVYGVQAANGVMLITTKKGKAGQMRISYDGYYGIQRSLGNPDVVGAADWMRLANEYNLHDVNNNGTRNYSQTQINAYANGTSQSTNWYPYVLRKNAPEQHHNLSASGGTENFTYYISLGYLNQNSFLKTNDYNDNRYNVRSNVSAKFAKRLTAELQLNGIYEDRHTPYSSTMDIFKNLYRIAPINQVYVNNDPSMLTYVTDTQNPMAISNSAISGYKTYGTRTFQGSFSLNYDVPYITGLRAKGLFSLDYYINDNKEFGKVYTLYQPTATTPIPNVQGTPANVRRSYQASPRSLLNYSLEYNRTFNSVHNINILGLYEERTTKSDNFQAYRQLVFSSLDQLAGGYSDNTQIANQNILDLVNSVSKSFVGKIHYDFSGKYLLDLSARYDGSSLFSGKKQWGLFPAASAGWRISEENFIKNNKDLAFINNIKLRGSYGATGDASALNFQFLSGYDYPVPSTASNYNNTGTNYEPGRLNPGSVFNGNYVTPLGFRGFPNTDITWYAAKTVDLGIDADFWKGLFGFQFDWFKRDRDGLLATRTQSLPGSAGASLPQENLNSDRNFGFELVLTHKYKIGGLVYEINGNFSYTRKKNLHVERAPAGNQYDNWRNNTNDRYTDIWWGKGDAGRFESLDEIYTYPVNQGSGNRSVLPGDYKYQDWNNDGFIDAGDDHPIAGTYADQGSQPAPGYINYGWDMNFEYKGFDLDALFQGVAQRWIGYGGPFALSFPWPNSNVLSAYLDRWHPADPASDPYNPNTQWVSGRYAYTGISAAADYNSVAGIQNASYLRLKALTLGYTIPSYLTKKIGIQKCRVYINGYNLLTFTKLEIVDPEHPGDQASYAYPLAKTYNVGLNITF